MSSHNIIEFSLRMGDNCLILGQRLGAWCGHAPALEEDIALANMALDLIGQAKLWLSYAAELEDKGRTPDDLAFLRNAQEFRNSLLVEQPNADYGTTLMRQFLFDSWHYPMLEALSRTTDQRVADIAQKAVKEAAYHLERSTDLIIRLGDGSDESHARMQAALDTLWPFAADLMSSNAGDAQLSKAGIAPDLAVVRARWSDHVARTLEEATLNAPKDAAVRQSVKQGAPSKELGAILAEMQFLQRAHPGAKW